MYFFEIETDVNGEFFWEWKAPNGNALMRSPKTYQRREGVMTAIAVIRRELGQSVIRDRTLEPALLRR